MLCSLPPSYKTFVDNLLYRKDSISLDDVSDSLKSKELKKNFSDNRERFEGEGLMSKRKTHSREGSSSWKKSKSRSKSRMKKANCFECREQGHYKKDCSKLKNKKEKQPESSANVVDSFIDSNSDDSAEKILSISSDHGQNSWILDTGAAYNTCPHRNWFVTYKQMSGKMFLGNDRALSVEEIGNIRLRIFDGVVRTIEC